MVMTNEEFAGKTPTPESLIRLSLKHLEETEKHPHYYVYMSDWFHYPLTDSGDFKCGLCLGASTLVFGLGLSLDRIGITGCWVDHVPPVIRQRIKAIDDLRVGGIRKALERLGCWHPWEISNGRCKEQLRAYAYTNMPYYDQDPRHFKKEMLHLADKLEGYKLLINTNKYLKGVQK